MRRGGTAATLSLLHCCKLLLKIFQSPFRILTHDESDNVTRLILRKPGLQELGLSGNNLFAEDAPIPLWRILECLAKAYGCRKKTQCRFLVRRVPEERMYELLESFGPLLIHELLLQEERFERAAVPLIPKP